MLSTGVGTIAWVAILVAAGWLILNTWREAQSIWAVRRRRAPGAAPSHVRGCPTCGGA